MRCFVLAFEHRFLAQQFPGEHYNKARYVTGAGLASQRNDFSGVVIQIVDPGYELLIIVNRILASCCQVPFSTGLYSLFGPGVK
jgi:hypothetical protein